MGSIHRNTSTIIISRPPDSILVDLATAWRQISMAPLDVYCVVKIISIENYCRLIYGIEATNDAVTRAYQQDPLLLTAEEESAAATYRYGSKTHYQKLGLAALDNTVVALKATHPELANILEGRQDFPFEENAVLRRLVSTNRYDVEDGKPTLSLLAKAYFLFGKAEPTGADDCPRKKQGAIAAVGTMLWGVTAWQAAVNWLESMELPGNNLSRVLSFESWQHFQVPVGFWPPGSSQHCLAAAVAYVNRAVAEFEGSDGELAEILKWNVFGKQSF